MLFCGTQLVALVVFGGPILAAALLAAFLVKSGRRNRSASRLIAGFLLWLPTGLFAFWLARTLVHSRILSLRDTFGEVPASVTDLTSDHHDGCDHHHLYFRFRVSPADYRHLSDAAQSRPGMVRDLQFPASSDFYHPPAWWAMPPDGTIEFLHMLTPDNDTSAAVPLVTIAMWYHAASETAFVYRSEMD